MICEGMIRVYFHLMVVYILYMQNERFSSVLHGRFLCQNRGERETHVRQNMIYIKEY
jgi:hypothetical protein